MSRSRRLRAPLAAAGLTLGLVACGGSGPTPTPIPTATPAPAAIEIVTTEFAYDPDDLEVPAGETVAIRLVNKGVVEHDLTIDALAVTIKVPIAGTADGTLPALEAGTYDFYCSIPGHKENGMVGTLVAG
jgi:plastocyanin